MSKRQFTTDQMRAILYRDEGQVHLDEITSHSRWTIHHRLIFSPEGEQKLYEAHYETAATELQAHPRPFEYDEECNATEVEAFEKKVVDYRPVGTGE
jgi:hypothetical protein